MPTETESHDRPENFLVSDRISDQVTAPEMVLDSLWPARTIGLFTGDGGIGKTHFTFQLLKLIASGGEIAGTPFRCATPRDVVFVSQEDEADFLLAELFSQFPELRGGSELSRRIRIISTALRGSNLFLTDSRSSEYLMEHLPEGCCFALDSWSTFLSTDENNNTELLRKEIAKLREIMKARKATALLIHHRPKRNAQTGIQSSFRGGTALPNSCRFHIMFERKAGREVRLSFEKVSRGDTPDPLTLLFDQEQKLLVPVELDTYLSVFQPDEELTTTEVMVRLGKDPQNRDERHRVLSALRYRSRGGRLTQTQAGTRGQDSVWKRTS